MHVSLGKKRLCGLQHVLGISFNKFEFGLADRTLLPASACLALIQCKLHHTASLAQLVRDPRHDGFKDRHESGACYGFANPVSEALIGDASEVRVKAIDAAVDLH